MKQLSKCLMFAFCLLAFSSAYAKWECRAQNAAGHVWVGGGYHRALAANRALEKCRAQARRPGTCYIAGRCFPKAPKRINRVVWECHVGRGKWVGTGPRREVAIANAVNYCMINARHHPNRCTVVQRCFIRR